MLGIFLTAFLITLVLLLCLKWIVLAVRYWPLTLLIIAGIGIYNLVHR